MRRQRASRGLIVMLLGLVAAGSALGAQPQGSEPIQLAVGSTDGPPQSEVTVEASLGAALPGLVKALTLSITFPKKLLLFSRAEASGTLNGQGEISAEVRDHEHDADLSVVDLILSSIPEEMPGLELGEGPLFEITFVIYEAAEPGSDIVLESEISEIVMEETGAPPVSVTAGNGTISVIESLIFSCFFYMH